MSRIINFAGWVLVGYIVLFVLTFMLYMGCTEDGHSVAECKNNYMTQAVIAPINLLR